VTNPLQSQAGSTNFGFGHSTIGGLPWFTTDGHASSFYTFVFCPNIRGSTGYGTDFMTSNRKDWGGNDYKDMMAGIDYLIKNEGIDSARLGIAGWSYGKYMAEWAITQTTRFKASVSGAGIVPGAEVLSCALRTHPVPPRAAWLPGIEP
jgi:dienelactone hydrolase